MRLKWSLLMVSLCANSVIAQGTMLFTWHGTPAPYDYQASFQAPGDVLVLGWSPNDWPTSAIEVMDRTLQITDMWGNPYSQANATVTVLGSGGTANWGILVFAQMVDSGLLIQSDYAYGQSGYFNTTKFGVGTSFWEYGYWDYTFVPEPSTGSMLLLGVFVWVLNSRRR